MTHQNYVFVTNRNDTTVTRLESETESVVNLKNAFSDKPEPMYIVHRKKNHELWVGYRGLNEVHVYNEKTLDIIAKIPTLPGIFHMATDQNVHKVAVVCDTSKKIMIISTKLYEVIATIDLPADLSTYVLHDVAMSNYGIFVSLIGSNSGYVIKYTHTYVEERRLHVGNVPHLLIRESYNYLYVVSESANLLYKVCILTLLIVSQTTIPSPHGICGTKDGKRLYITNIASVNGSQSIYHVLTCDLSIANIMDARLKNPHNIITSSCEKKLFITHSYIGSTQISAYELDSAGVIDNSTEIETGKVPFGIISV